MVGPAVWAFHSVPMQEKARPRTIASPLLWAVSTEAGHTAYMKKKKKNISNS